MILASLWPALEASSWGSTVASSEWAFPMLETAHVIAIVTVFGSIVMMDLRLVGLISKNLPLTQLSRDTLPMTWVAFVIAAITGSLLFISKATSYTINPWFLIKMGLIAVAGLNMLAFHMITWRGVRTWDMSPSAIPRNARLAGALSLILWLAVLFCGRMIGFTLGMYQPS